MRPVESSVGPMQSRVGVSAIALALVCIAIAAIMAIGCAKQPSTSTGKQSTPSAARATPSASSSENAGIDLPQFTIHLQELDETPGKTMVREEIIVRDQLTAETLEALLRARLDNTKELGPFKYHPSPTVVGIYVYPSTAHADAGMGQWIGMLSLLPVRREPEISINETNLRAQSEPFTDELGLTESVRRKIFLAIVQAEDQATREGLARKEELGNRVTVEQIHEIAEWESKRREELIEAVRTKYELTNEKIRNITREALEENWPFPATQ